MTQLRRPTGMAAFTVIWLGQILSTAGTRMINFALAIWVWQETDRASDLALMTLLAFAATVVLSPAAGSLVDRWSRRTSIIMSDLGAAIAAGGALVLFATGTASFWSLVVVNTVSGAFLAFQYPAYSTLVTSMLPEHRYSRANAMISLVRSVPAVFAPGIAGVLMAFSGISFILVVSVIAYGVAILTVFLVSIPAVSPAEHTAATSIWQDSLFGFRYLASRPGFLGMQAILFVIGMVSAMGFILLTPLVLIKTGNNEAQLGAVNSIGAVGGVLGALLVGGLKPPVRKVPWILLSCVVFSLFGRVLMAFGDTFAVWAVAWFVSWMTVPFVEAYVQTIWQQKIALPVQGRVFAAMQFLSQLALLVGFAVTGTLVDHVFEPAARHRDGIASWFTPLIGSSPGSGMKLVFLFSGGLGILAAAWGALSPAIRGLERAPSPLDPDPSDPGLSTASKEPEPTDEERSTHDDDRAAVPGHSQ